MSNSYPNLSFQELRTHIAELAGLIALLKVTMWPEGVKTIPKAY
jgi:hypothetical protein